MLMIVNALSLLSYHIMWLLKYGTDDGVKSVDVFERMFDVQPEIVVANQYGNILSAWLHYIEDATTDGNIYG
jgi:hypothetical protein